MKDLPDHVNRHRSFHPGELPRRYRRMRFEDTGAMVREWELDLESPLNNRFWNPWVEQYGRPDDDYISSDEMLHRIAWDLVFESGAPIAGAVPPEKWAQMEALFSGGGSAPPRTELFPQRRETDFATLASRLKGRLETVRTKPHKDCANLLRAEMKLVNIGQLGELLSFCERRHPADITSLRGAVTTMMLLRPFWIRPLSSWKMAAQNAVEAFDSLLAHLFVEYPVPPFLYEAWTFVGGYSWPLSKWIAWFVLLGRGASLHRAGDIFGWRAPEDFVAHLMGAPRDLTPFEACVWAEVHRLGGSPAEFRRIRAHESFAVDVTAAFGEWVEDGRVVPRWFVQGQQFTERFLKFWRETVPWLARHRDQLNDEDCTAIFKTR